MLMLSICKAGFYGASKLTVVCSIQRRHTRLNAYTLWKKGFDLSTNAVLFFYTILHDVRIAYIT
jgi:hypothetical protein